MNAAARISTDADPIEWLESLASPWFLEEQGLRALSYVDGASLHKVADEHYVVIQCMEHIHRGAEYLARVMPEGWGQFAVVHGEADPYVALHWGPA